MNRNILVATIAVVVAGGVLFYLFRPEPTPQGRITDAAERAADAAREAAGEAGEAVKEEVASASFEMSNSLADAVETLSDLVTEMSDATRNRIAQLRSDLRTTGVVTEDGIDFDAAIAAVENSDLTIEAKEDTIAFLEALRNAPDHMTAQLEAFESALSSSSFQDLLNV